MKFALATVAALATIAAALTPASSEHRLSSTGSPGRDHSIGPLVPGSVLGSATNHVANEGISSLCAVAPSLCVGLGGDHSGGLGIFRALKQLADLSRALECAEGEVEAEHARVVRLEEKLQLQPDHDYSTLSWKGKNSKSYQGQKGAIKGGMKGGKGGYFGKGGQKGGKGYYAKGGQKGGFKGSKSYHSKGGFKGGKGQYVQQQVQSQLQGQGQSQGQYLDSQSQGQLQGQDLQGTNPQATMSWKGKGGLKGGKGQLAQLRSLLQGQGHGQGQL